MFDANRRKFPRAAYRCQVTMWRADGSSQVIMATTSNIGAGGVGLLIDQPLLIDTRVDLRIDFTVPNMPFKCKGKVVRCEPKSKMYDLGIMFEGLDDIKVAFLEGKVSELIEKESHGS